jgi:hypothetical protein
MIYEWMKANNDSLFNAFIAQANVVYRFNRNTFLRSIVQYLNYDYNVDNYTFNQI